MLITETEVNLVNLIKTNFQKKGTRFPRKEQGSPKKNKVCRSRQVVKNCVGQDEKAQFHDMAYSIFKDKNQRHVFDKKLQNEAAEIARDPTSTMKEKMEAGLVSGIMFGKRKLGLGK